MNEELLDYVGIVIAENPTEIGRMKSVLTQYGHPVTIGRTNSGRTYLCRMTADKAASLNATFRGRIELTRRPDKPPPSALQRTEDEQDC